MGCVYCGREISNVGSLKSHEACCKLNPSRVERPRSPNAGRKKGCAGPTKGMKLGRRAEWDERFPLSAVLVENSTYPRGCVKKRIIANNLIPYVCSCCGIGPEWHGKEMPLILDHINGINNDNRLENLRFVCSNCDSTLPTYKSRNRKK